MADNKKSRSNIRNTGLSFQKTIVEICKEYNRIGIAKIEKVDPPTRIIGTGYKKRIIFMENPFPDFAGTWTAYGGRSIHLEAKSKLKFDSLPCSIALRLSVIVSSESSPA